MNFRPCAVVPVYNHHTSLARIVAALRAEGLPVILVDDGSDAVTKSTLTALTGPGVEVLTRPRNGGKGAAMLAGLAHAAVQGHTHALQVDADGQHDLGDVPAMLKLAAEHPHHLISGTPKYDESVPKVRFYGRYLTHILVWLVTLSFTLKDSMCGFRIYPIEPMLKLRSKIGPRMDFDTDAMVRLYWAGTESLFLPTRVHYPEDGVSHYRMLRDNLRMLSLHLRLELQMLPRIPMLIARNLRRHRQQHWAHIGERGTLTGLRLIGAMDRLFPRWIGHLVLYPVTLYFFLSHPQARQASRRFLTAAGAHATLGMSFRHFFSFSISILDKVAAWYAPERIPMDLSEESRALFLGTLNQGRGLLLLSAHLGNLELARAIATLIPGVTINALVYTQNSKKLNAVLEETSDDYALKLIYVEEIGPDTAVLLRSKIDAGEVVVIVGDRVPVMPGRPMGRTQGTTVQAEFLGRPAPFAMGPYVLAHVLECPVLLFFCLREGAGYKVHLEPFAERIVLPRQSRDEAARSWAGRYAARLADYATRFPLQWYNFYDFWAEAPAPKPVTGTDG
ncbi:MAG TPA: glycosyltransferase [Gammaproteobacteria bacterium]|jgi:predicted LPLAT superfamily acyltransferase